jgi:serine/threonine protein kinase
MAIDSERLRQIEELYHLARERTPGARGAFLQEVCGKDGELLRNVLALLAQDSGAGPMETPVIELAASLLNDTRWTAGTKVGPYQIVGRLGQGGMAEVFEARDTRLGRNVAVKIAHAEFTGRFQREALAISALNHPHICTLYDVGSNYLVMELVEGETLTRHLSRGRLPMELVLRYGAQLADALSAAHAKGITHRDLKPGNIVVAKAGVKVLDFGLAQFARDPELAAHLVETASTSRSIIGTPAYMAPEQLQGKECDARTDIFALGLVLYQMATGRKAFTADSQAELIAEVMRSQPDLTGLTPPSFAHIVERCLAKDPEDRWQTARDVKLELEFLGRTSPERPSAVERKRRRWPAAVGLLAVLAAALTLGALYFRSGQVDFSAVPLTSYPGRAMRPSLSPDGTRVAFIWDGEQQGNFDVYVKQIGPGNALPLTKSPQDEMMCRWSPDGKWIAFLRQGDGDTGEVYVVPVLTGLEKKLGDAALQIRDNTTLGGYVDCLDWSPDAQWLVISRRSSPGQSRGLDLQSVKTGEIRHLTSPASPQFDVFAAFAPDGHALAFLRRNTAMRGSLMLLPLSASLQARGTEMEIATSLDPSIRTFAWTADSRELIASAGYPESARLWRFRPSTGVTPRLLSFEGAEPAISGRGNRLVLSRDSVEWNIWSLELDDAGRALGPPVRAFDSSKNEITPRFSPDGSKVAFGSNRSGFHEIWICRSDGSACDQITEMKTWAGSPAWSPDGSRITFDDVGGVYVVSAAGGNPLRLADGFAPHWSKSGEWVYYSFRGQIYRISPSGGEPRLLISERGGTSEESPDGEWLYYLRRGGQSLYRMPSTGGASTQMLPSVEERNFVPLKRGIWYFTPNTKEGSRLEYYDFSTQSSRTVFRTSRPVFAGMTLSPDGRRLLFTQVDRSPSRDLMLVDNFR